VTLHLLKGKKNAKAKNENMVQLGREYYKLLETYKIEENRLLCELYLPF